MAKSEQNALAEVPTPVSEISARVESLVLASTAVTDAAAAVVESEFEDRLQRVRDELEQSRKALESQVETAAADFSKALKAAAEKHTAKLGRKLTAVLHDELGWAKEDVSFETSGVLNHHEQPGASPATVSFQLKQHRQHAAAELRLTLHMPLSSGLQEQMAALQKLRESKDAVTAALLQLMREEDSARQAVRRRTRGDVGRFLMEKIPGGEAFLEGLLTSVNQDRVVRRLAEVSAVAEKHRP